MRWASRSVPSVAITRAWVSPRVNSAEPWARGSTPLRISIWRTVRVVAAVDARLAGEDLAAHDARFDVEQQVVDLARLVEVGAFGLQCGDGAAVTARVACVRACFERIW